ncbi:hypothetical protein CFOL_v3_29159, partial [Cephalotus follicularis]
MDKKPILPFKVAQVVEARSFLKGYRGAWFRCKIKEFGRKNGGIVHALEYFDFPDEKIRWTKIYQKPPYSGCKSKERKRQLMVRPNFPPVYRESQMPDVCTISDVIVIVNDIWKVGDLVDWWTDGCYWSGRVTDMLGDEKVRIELLPPPMGEGYAYEVFCKDLRPSLDWSPDNGWAVPSTMVLSLSCIFEFASILYPVRVSSSMNFYYLMPKPLKVQLQDLCMTTIEYNLSRLFHFSANSLPTLKQPLRPTASKSTTHTPAKNVDFDLGGSDNRKRSYSDSVSSSHVRDASAEVAGAGIDKYHRSGSLKKTKTDESISLNCMHSDTIEAAILDLEELVSRVQWIKGILDFGMHSSNTVQSSWKFVEHRASS